MATNAPSRRMLKYSTRTVLVIVTLFAMGLGIGPAIHWHLQTDSVASVVAEFNMQESQLTEKLKLSDITEAEVLAFCRLFSGAEIISTSQRRELRQVVKTERVPVTYELVSNPICQGSSIVGRVVTFRVREVSAIVRDESPSLDQVPPTL